MKNTTQVLALAMAVAMAAGLLAGCGSKAAYTTTEENTEAAESTDEAK